MSKLTLSTLTTLSAGSAITALNNNFAAIVTAMENTLSRDGTSPNYMDEDLDMNSSRIVNLIAATTDTEPVRLAEFQTGMDDLETTVQGIASTTQGYLNSVISLYDSFDDRYLGPFSSDPSVDNDGNALITGAIYWNTSTNIMKVWTGTAWTGVISSTSGFLLDDLGDVTVSSVATGDTLRYNGSQFVNYASSNFLDRANHTGTQLSATISDFTEAAQDATGAMVDGSLVYTDSTPLLQRAALTGAVTASAGSNTTSLGSFTKAQLTTAVSDGDPLYVGDITQYTDELAQDAIGSMVNTTLVYVDATPALGRAAITGHISIPAGSNTSSLSSFTLAELNTAVSDTNLYSTTQTDSAITSGIASAVGVSVQAFDATLAALAGITTAVNKLIYATGVDTFSTTDFSAFGRTLVDDADAATARATISAEQLGVRTALNSQSGTSYTLVLTDAGKVLETTNAASVTITIPPNSSVAFATGTWIDFYQYGAGQVTLAPGAGVTLRAADSKLKTRAQYSALTIVKRGTDEWVVFGDASA